MDHHTTEFKTVAPCAATYRPATLEFAVMIQIAKNAVTVSGTIESHERGDPMSGYKRRDAARDTDASIRDVTRAWHNSRTQSGARTDEPHDRPTAENRSEARAKTQEIVERGRNRERAETRKRERSENRER